VNTDKWIGVVEARIKQFRVTQCKRRRRATRDIPGMLRWQPPSAADGYSAQGSGAITVFSLLPPPTSHRRALPSASWDLLRFSACIRCSQRQDSDLGSPSDVTGRLTTGIVAPIPSRQRVTHFKAQDGERRGIGSNSWAGILQGASSIPRVVYHHFHRCLDAVPKPGPSRKKESGGRRLEGNTGASL
jgi:hypothetical protein